MLSSGFSFIAQDVRRTRHLALGRGLVLCFGCLTAAALAEGFAAGWRSWSHRLAPLTYGTTSVRGGVIDPPENSEVNITVLGESSAAGVPFESWLSIGKIIAWRLEEAVPGKLFRVELLAKPGDTLAGQYQKLAAVRRRPDVLIVYCGHNEFDSVIPWTHRVEHYLDDQLPPHVIAYESARHLSSFCGLIRAMADVCRVAVLPPGNAHPPFIDVPAYTPADFEARLDDFRRRLAAIAQYGNKVHAQTVLVIPPGNDGGFDPNRSFLAPSTSRAEREAFEREFGIARQTEDSDQARAVEMYRKLLARQPGFAETHYRLGVLLSRARAWDEAYQHFVAARDLDGFPMRCVTAFQETYREVAAQYQCILLDGQSLFRAIGHHGLLDDHIFHDAMHPSFVGQVALAQNILDALYARQAFGWSAGRLPSEINLADCAAHFGFEVKDWKTLCEKGAMFYYATIPMRFDRTYRQAKFEAFEAGARRIAAGEPPEEIGLPNIGIPTTARIRPEATPRLPSGPLPHSKGAK